MARNDPLQEEIPVRYYDAFEELGWRGRRSADHFLVVAGSAGADVSAQPIVPAHFSAATITIPLEGTDNNLPSSISSELEDLGDEVLEDGGEVWISRDRGQRDAPRRKERVGGEAYRF